MRKYITKEVEIEFGDALDDIGCEECFDHFGLEALVKYADTDSLLSLLNPNDVKDYFGFVEEVEKETG